MKMMLVDDEKLALMRMERMLINAFIEKNREDCLSGIVSFQFVSEALEYAKEYKPDIIFLDIQMPEMTGLEAAEYFQDILPNVEIVFVTAYDEFAVTAFEYNALDYLLKPVTVQRLNKTLERILNLVAPKEKIEANHSLEITNQKIYCFNTIRFQVKNGPIVYPRWRTAKAQELFAYLLHYRGEFVPKYAIINMFSPELDKKRAMTQLYTVVYQIRKCLKEANISIKIENDSIQEGYCLHLEDTLLDVEQWEGNIKGLSKDQQHYYLKLEELLYQYEGDYMGNYDYLWAESERERLRQIWLTHATELIQHFYSSKNWIKLLKLGDRFISINSYEFDYNLYMMEAYDQLGQYDKLKQFYDKQEKMLGEELDIPLPDDMIQWYEAWLISRKGVQYKV